MGGCCNSCLTRRKSEQKLESKKKNSDAVRLIHATEAGDDCRNDGETKEKGFEFSITASMSSERNVEYWEHDRKGT